MTDAIKRAIEDMKHGALHHYALPGLTSYLIGGEGHGTVRLFESDRDTREWIVPHSHRFDFTCLVLAGEVVNTLFMLQTWDMPGSNHYCNSILTPIDGGLGKYDLRPVFCGSYTEHSTTYAAGDTYSMEAAQIHSIKFSRGAKVLFFEGPRVQDFSVILEPWSNGKRVPTFETRPWMFERERPYTETETSALEGH